MLLVTVWPFLVWRSTHYLFTNERVILQQGVLLPRAAGHPAGPGQRPLDDQHFFERLLGCGTLTIESAGERGQSVLTDIPQVEKVQTTLYELVEADRDKHSLGDDEMREIMADVREGKPLRTDPTRPDRPSAHRPASGRPGSAGVSARPVSGAGAPAARVQLGGDLRLEFERRSGP